MLPADKPPPRCLRHRIGGAAPEPCGSGSRATQRRACVDATSRARSPLQLVNRGIVPKRWRRPQQRTGRVRNPEATKTAAYVESGSRGLARHGLSQARPGDAGRGAVRGDSGALEADHLPREAAGFPGSQQRRRAAAAGNSG